MSLEKLKKLAIAKIGGAQLGEARPLWNQVCEQEPLNVDNWLILSAVDEQLGFYDAAIDHLKYPFHLTAEEPDVWLQSARLHWKKHSFTTAVDHIHAALALDFTNNETRHLAAEWLLLLGMFKQSAHHFDYLICNKQNIEKNIWVDACASAYLDQNTDLIQSWQGYLSKNNLDKTALHTSIALRILSLTPPNKATKSQLKQDECTLVADINREILANQAKAIPDYFDTTAHTKEMFLDEDQTKQLSEIIKRVSKISLNYKPVYNCIEIGCGVGYLGQQLRATTSQVVLTGINFSDQEQAVAIEKTDYDNLLTWQEWLTAENLIVKNANLVIINEQSNYFLDVNTLLTQLLHDLPPTSHVIIVMNAANKKQIANLKKLVIQPWSAKQTTLSDNGSLLTIKQQKTIEPTTLSNRYTQDMQLLEQHANNLIHATALISHGDYSNAEKSAKHIAKTYPNSSKANYVLGICAQHRKKYPEAIKYLRLALRDNGHYSDAWFQIATVWHALGRNKGMLISYNRCLKYAPAHTATLKNLVVLFLSEGNLQKVYGYLQLLLLNNALDKGTLDFVNDITSSNKELNKNLKQFYTDKAWLSAQFQDALNRQYFERCNQYLLQLKPHCEKTEYTLLEASLLEKSGKIGKAIELIETLSNSAPENVEYLKILRSYHLNIGNLEQAHSYWNLALKHYDHKDGDILGGLFVSNYYDFISDEKIADYHINWATNLTSSLSNIELKKKKETTKLSPATKDKGKSKIRVGYVSGDFKTHSVSLFLYNIYKHHNKDQFEIVSYSAHAGNDGMTTKFEFFSDQWRDISQLNDEQAAAKIRTDEIDILVDLSGHTGHNRLPLFALRPAPIQCTYLGYANTTGLTQMDYRFTDNICDPVGDSEHLHSEELVRLPNGFLSYSRHFGAPPILLSPKSNQHRHYTFVCCNNILKVSFRVVSVFAEILKRLPGSTLLIKAHNLNNIEIITRYEDEFKRLGIKKDRVHLMNAIDMNVHQSLYNHTDIALDPFPYNGTTTTCDALWMGVPLLTLRGTRHSGRVGASIMTTIGMTDWIAETEQEYIDKAISFASDPEKLQAIKLNMRQKLLNSPLMQPEVVCRDIEAEYLKMCS